MIEGLPDAFVTAYKDSDAEDSARAQLLEVFGVLYIFTRVSFSSRRLAYVRPEQKMLRVVARWDYDTRSFIPPV